MNLEQVKKKPFDVDRLFPLVFWTAIGFHLLLLWNCPILPFIDLPFRLAASTIARFFDEPTNQFAQYYTVDTFLKPNSFHLLFCSLNIFPSVDFANKIFYSLYIVLLPFSVLTAVKKIGGSTWFSLLSFLLLYNYSVGWGFSEFSMSIPIVIVLFCYLIDHFKRGGIVPMLAVMFLSLLLFFIHVVALLFSLFLFLAFLFYYCRKTPARMIKKGVVILPVLILILLWWRIDASQNSQFSLSYLWFYFKNFWPGRLLSDRANLLSWDNFSLFAGTPGKMTAFFFSLFIIFPLLITKRVSSETNKDTRNYKNDKGRKRFHFFTRLLIFLNKNPEKRKSCSRAEVESSYPAVYIFLGCAFFFYLFIPHQIADNFHLFQRFAVFVLLAVIFLDSLVFRKGKRINTAIIVSVCAVLLLHFFLWADYFRDFKKETQTFTEDLFPEGVTGKKLAGLIYDYKFRGRPIFIHFPNYYITWKQGIASTCLIDYRFGTVRRKASKTALPPHRRIEWVGMRKLYDGRYSSMDYILVRGQVPEAHKKYMRNFTLNRTAGKWSLYRNQFPAAAHALPETSKVKADSASPPKKDWAPCTAGLIDEFSVISDEPYLWSEFEQGKKIYIDRPYVYTSVPSGLTGQAVLHTANNDKYYGNSNIEFPFISFRVQKDVTVYIIYTNRYTNMEKTWLNRDNGWIKENFTVEASQIKEKSKRLVCSKFFCAGTWVELGGNGCLKRNCDMYTVVIKRNE